MKNRTLSPALDDRKIARVSDPSSLSRKNVSATLISPPANGSNDFRHRLGREFDFSRLVVKPNGHEFLTLGRMNGFNNVKPEGALAPEKRALITERVKIEEAGGDWKRYDEVGLTPQDMMALINEGTQTPPPDLSRQIDLWWKERESDPLWQKPDHQETAPTPQAEYDVLQHRRRIQQIVDELQISEREIPRLLRFDKFSRRTAYVRDYAAIPRMLRRLFKMEPDCICTPSTCNELVKFVQYAAKHKIPLTPRGRGTWALGGALATKGGLILDLANFEKTIEVDPTNRLVTVSCAVDFQSLEEELQHYGLTLLVRPSNKYANIGGFCSVGDPGKGGAGLFAFSNGHIGNVVEKLEVAIPTSRDELKALTKADPELANFLGTNGRNGIITKITMRVGGRARGREGEGESGFPVAVSFSSFRQALNFAKKLRDEVSAHDVTFRPLHVEAFSASYLKALHFAAATSQHPLPISNDEQIVDNHEPRTFDAGLRTTNDGLPERDSLLVVFAQEQELRAFERYALEFGHGVLVDHHGGRVLWEERFQPLKLRRRGDLLTSELMLPLESVADYLDEVMPLAEKLGVQLLPICYMMDNGEALVIPQFLTDRRKRFQYYRHFSLVPVLARRAIKNYSGRPYGFGIWMAGLFKLSMGKSASRQLQVAKVKYDPRGVLNPGKLTEIRSRFFNLAGYLLLNRFSVAAIDIAWRAPSIFGKLGFVRNQVLKTETPGYDREKFDALHRCIKCSACFVCPLAQVWQKSGDPKLQRDAIYITPRFKMEYMQRHLFEGKKLSQEDIDRFALCFRCGIAEREHICPISDMLLEVKPAGDTKLVQIQTSRQFSNQNERHSDRREESLSNSGDQRISRSTRNDNVNGAEATACKKEFPTYDAFEDLLRKEGYDVDGAIRRYTDILKTHPGVSRAMQEVLGKYRVPKNGDLVVLKPKTDFAIYKVDVDQDKCINCGKCGDEHTTSQRGFWDPRNPRRMVSLDDLIRELNGKIPLTWFRDLGGPIPDFLKTQGVVHKGYVQLPPPNQLDLGHHHCNGCLYCVIECPVDAIRVHINPYFENLSGRDFDRNDVRRLNEESRNGDVPTSGTGSTGLFGGKGFDRYMFDFSVIVRPTRDGIREAIDINVNLGRKPLFHLYDKASHIVTNSSTIDLATPMVLEYPNVSATSPEKLASVFARAASREKTLCLMTLPEFAANFENVKYFAANIGLKISTDDISIFEHIVAQSARLSENSHSSETAIQRGSLGYNAAEVFATLRQIPLVLLRANDAPADLNVHDARLTLLREIFSPHAHLGVWLNVPAGHVRKEIANKALDLARAGIGIIYLKCEWNDALGYYDSGDVLPEVYDHLCKNAAHSQVTLLANGIKSPADLGVALMLGATAGVIDRAAVVAMNHEFPMLEKDGHSLPDFAEDAGLHRVQNLFKSWHKQIREVLGAFGVRDIRRTVGERGRLIDLRERAKIMQSIVTDTALREKSEKENREKIQEDGELAKQQSWKYSDLERLIQPVTAPNYNLLGDRQESLASMLSARGDRRWTAEVLAGTWEIASGVVPSSRVPQTGKDFGAGSFDSMNFAPVHFGGTQTKLAEAVAALELRLQNGDEKLRAELDSISTSAGISTRHQRQTTAPVVSAFPIDGADMSLGSIGWRLTLARYISSMILKRFVGTGEGGYPLEKAERLYPYFPNLDHAMVRWLCRQLEAWVATQTATGYFGVSEDTIKRARKLVLKFAQGAKPGLGGHILGPKVTLQVEDMRGVIAGISVFSPFPFHDVYSIEDVTKMIEWLRTVNPDAIITVKISTPVDVYHVALGLVTAGADEIQIDATAGGTGAAPDIARNRIAMPLEFAMVDVHKFLVEQGMRNQVILVASGGCRTAYDVAKAFILGADKVILGTQEIVADQCNRCGNCEASGGCQKGITTTVPQLEEQKDLALNAQWIINAQASVMLHLIKMLHVWGIRDIRELRGRFDLIESWGWEEHRAEGGGQRAENDERRAKSVERVASSETLDSSDFGPRTEGPRTEKEKYEDREVDACGVVSFACTKTVPVYSIQTACQRMHNRGNGRGGGVLALGGMFPAVNNDKYAMQVNVLCSEEKRQALMAEIAKKYFGDLLIFDRNGQPIAQWPDSFEAFRNPRFQKHGRDITWEEAGLAVDPGDIFRFFVRVKPAALLQFAKDVLVCCGGQRAEGGGQNASKLPKYLNIAGKWLDYYIKYSVLLTEEFLAGIDANGDFQNDPATQQFWGDLEDEYIYRLAFRLNQEYYIDPQAQKRNPEAYVASMMKDGAIWKLVGYAEQAADYWLVTDAEYRPIAALDKTLDEMPALGETSWRVRDYLKRYLNGEEVNRELTHLAPQVKVIHEESQLTVEIGTAQLIVPSRQKRDNDRFVMNYQTGAHVWIGHQRFPTVFSPYSGGSHPFYGRINEALIHNGDFANYVAMVRFWDQFGGAPQFRTDTEMAAKAFGILKQMAYPTPHLIEAIAPTTGLDLARLKKLDPLLAADFEAIQKSQIAGSPDGPWFFIIADSIVTPNSDERTLRMLGVTDTSVLRPSVFAWIKSSNAEKWASIGLIGSEEQALRSVLDTLYRRGTLPTKEPDRVTIVRGGSVDVGAAGRPTGGGTIIYSLTPVSDSKGEREKGRVGEGVRGCNPQFAIPNPQSYEFEVRDKFGNEMFTPGGEHADLSLPIIEDEEVILLKKAIYAGEGELVFASGQALFGFIRKRLAGWSYNTFCWLVQQCVEIAHDDAVRAFMIAGLTLARDQMEAIPAGSKKRSSLIHILQDGLDAIFDNIEKLGTGTLDRNYYRITRAEYHHIIPPPRKAERENGRVGDSEKRLPKTSDFELRTSDCWLVIDASDFPPEGHDSLARTVVEAYEKGWRKFIVYKQTGQRYLGCGLGPKSNGVEIHLYGNSGQDIANSMMGGTVIVHGDAQNDMSKILHSGTVVVHGLAGNTGLYGAKGGEVFVRKSTGIRWVINSVSSPSGPGLKVFIVGAPMEYLAESLMGGTVLVMGLDWNEKGELVRMLRPFPGNSILAGASAGKVILYDPFNQVEPAQYPNAVEIGFLPADWNEKFAHLRKLITARFTPAEWVNAMDKWKSYIDFSLREPAWTEKAKREAVVDLIEFAKTWVVPRAEGGGQRAGEGSAIRNPKSAMEMRLKEFVEDRFLDREWRRLMRVLAQVFPKNAWVEGIDYLERLHDWKEMRELLEKANHHFGLGLVNDGEEFVFTVDGQRLKLTRKDFKVIRPMTAKEKEHDEHEKKEAQKGFERRLKENYASLSVQVDRVRAFRRVFQAAQSARLE